MFHFWNLYHLLQISKKKMIVTTNVCLEFNATKYVVGHISKKPNCRTPFNSQHVNGSQISVKSASHYFYLNSPSLWAKLILKISLLVICEILGVFVNTLTADDKYNLGNCANLQLPITVQLSKKLKAFSQFFVPYLEFISTFKHFEQKTSVIVNIFPQLPIVKDLVRAFSKKRCFRTPFDSQHVKESRTLLKSAWEQFYHIFSSLWEKLIWKMSLLVICEMLEAIVNTLTVDGEFPFRNCENLKLPIQMQLSNKRKKIIIFFHFWHLHQILNNLK